MSRLISRIAMLCAFAAALPITAAVAMADSDQVAQAQSVPDKERSCQQCFDAAIHRRAPFQDGSCNHCTAPMLGAGRLDCEHWKKHRLNTGRQRQEDVSWLLGFISGYNQFESTQQKATWFHYDEPGLINAVDRECSAFPEKPVAEIAVKFLNGVERSKRSAGSKEMQP